MNNKIYSNTVRTLMALLLCAQSVFAIKIVVPDQYKDQVEDIKINERKEREQELRGSSDAADDQSISITGQAREVEASAASADEFLVQSVVEANATAAQYEGTLSDGEGLVSGQIVDKETGEPLSGVAILVEGADLATVTAEDGRYSLGPVVAGQYTLSFIKSGYIEANVTDYSITGGEVSVFPFALPPRPAEMSDEVYELQDFSVTAEEANNMMLKIDLRQNSIASLDMLGSEDFAKFAASDAAEAISKMSGASLSNGKYVVMRGLNDRYNTTLINGVRLPSPDPDRKAVAMDIFPTSLFEGIVVRKTYTADQPGESSGGSVELKTKSVPDEPFINFSTSLGAQLTSSQTDVFLADPEQVSLSSWLQGDDQRGFDLVAGSQALVDDYSSSVGGEGFPLTAPRIEGMSKYGDRNFSVSFGGSHEVNDWLTVGGVFGLKVAEKRRTSYTELYKIKIDQGNAVFDERAQASDTRVDSDGNTVQHGGSLSSEEEYSTSILLGLGAKIKDHTTLDYTYLRSETLTSSAEQVNYQKYEESEPTVTGVTGLLPNQFYNYTDYEVGSEEKLLEAHQFSGEHVFDLIGLSDWTFSWYYTLASMEQSEPDQRLIAEYLPDQFGQDVGAFAADPGLPPVTRFQRETEQASDMNGVKIEQEIEVSESITFNFGFGYDSESSEREFRQLESRISQDRFVDDVLYAAMPYPNQAGLSDVVDPDDAVNPILLYNESFVDENLENGVNELVEALYSQALANQSNTINELNGTLVASQQSLSEDLSNLSSAESSLNAAISSFESRYGVDYETGFDASNADHVLFRNFAIAPAQASVAANQSAVVASQDDVDEAQTDLDAQQSEFNELASEQAQYMSEALALINQISTMPAMAMDSTQFPTFSFLGDQGYILDTPRGFSIYADPEPTATNIQFNSVDGLFQAEGENEVDSIYVMGGLTFDRVPVVESMTVSTGLRSESTALSYELLPNALGEPSPVSGDGAGVSPFVVESSSIDQRDNLGYVAFIFDITDKLKLHLSQSTTVAKPTFREIAPFPIFNLSDKSFEQGNAGLMLRSANAYDDWYNRTGDFAGKDDSELPEKFVVPVEFAGLDIAEVESRDIRIDYYTPLDGLISVGYFTKSVGAPIERVFAYESSGVAVNTFINNNNDADLEGIEFEVQQNLGVFGDELWGIPLRWITLGGNYTKLDAEVTRSAFEMQNLTNERFANQLIDPDAFQEGGSYSTRPLYDQPAFVANAFISLDIQETGTRITLSQNWLGEQLSRAGGVSESQEGVADLYWDAFSSMNLVIEQQINETWSLKFAIKNLDSPVREMFEDEIFYNALSDEGQYQRSNPQASDLLSDSASGFVRSSQKIDPSYSISVSAKF